MQIYYDTYFKQIKLTTYIKHIQQIPCQTRAHIHKAPEKKVKECGFSFKCLYNKRHPTYFKNQTTICSDLKGQCISLLIPCSCSGVCK